MKYILGAVMLLLASYAHSCDRCSLMPAGMKYGRNSSFGASMRTANLSGYFPYQPFKLGYRHLEHTSGVVRGQFMDETYIYYAVQGLWRYNQQFHLEGQFTFSDNTRWVDAKTTDYAAGISNPIVAVFWTPITNINNDSLKFNHQLSIGAGVKFPLGETQQHYHDQPVIHDLQP